jgi:hypothetical protein
MTDPFKSKSAGSLLIADAGDCRCRAWDATFGLRSRESNGRLPGVRNQFFNKKYDLDFGTNNYVPRFGAMNGVLLLIWILQSCRRFLNITLY